jgi:hypothetical protein
MRSPVNRDITAKECNDKEEEAIFSRRGGPNSKQVGREGRRRSYALLMDVRIKSSKEECARGIVHTSQTMLQNRMHTSSSESRSICQACASDKRYFSEGCTSHAKRERVCWRHITMPTTAFGTKPEPNPMSLLPSCPERRYRY